MRVYITVSSSDYADAAKSVIPLKAVELADNYKVAAGTYSVFTDPVSGAQYRKIAVDLTDPAYKDEVINNFDLFVYNKTTGLVVPVANYAPVNRNITTPNATAPLTDEQFLSVFSL